MKQHTHRKLDPQGLAKGTRPGVIYQLKVTLQGSDPPIWRRLLVRGNTPLSTLHEILQIAMGWENYHPHLFERGGQHYGEPDPDDEAEIGDDQTITLREIVPVEKARFTYEYDFGDSWQHDMVVEQILPPQKDPHYPVCLAGERACPPEDVGGIWGYADFLAAVQDPGHEEHDSLLEWAGGTFDPEAFDVAAVNAQLRTHRALAAARQQPETQR